MEKNAQNSIVKRSPIVSIMGHIDHGKSTLLDYIRKTNIVDTEAGGITQRISAYEVVHKTPEGKEEKITFLDTPGHEAFGAMRVSGTSVADIAILVVSAEDGVKKQTLEAFKVITDADIPYIVAITKIDKPNANIDKVKNSLVENEIYIEGYGGTVPCVPISSKTGQGVPELMDMILLLAEMEELKLDANAPAEGVVIETHMDKQKGITSLLVLKNGSLKSGMYVVSGGSIASTRMIENFLGKKITKATASSPIRIIGFDVMPSAGVPFKSFSDKDEALEYLAKEKENMKEVPEKVEVMENPDGVTVRIMIKAEVAGAIQAIEHEINKIKSDKVRIKIIGSGIGNITENDVKLAMGKNHAIILGFDVGTDASAKDLAERSKIEIRTFDIIYKITEWLEEEVVKRTPKVMVAEIIAEAKVLKVFSTVKDKHIIGGRVEKGVIKLGQEVKISRKGVDIGFGKIKDLQKAKEKAEEIREGVEFGCQFKSDVIPAPGDKLEVFEMIEK
ncbi:MAG: translation initiation factor IF-2 [Candidatus Paceibacterota bacterium]|jgi:translation initiation factor IF-2